ncbi:MAG TPA: carbon-nitrogen hydrolase family protein [Dongiaceae bacterium]|nr:carbon-nitrogen hydrolase family protein [Dongiaceae bacterium]
MSKSFKAACVQMNSAAEIAPNLESASALIRAAAGAGAQLVMTPENTTLIEPNRGRALAKTPPEEAHPGVPHFAALAKERGLWLLIGSMPVRADDKRIANRSFLFDPNGAVAARYDKIHMFDVDLPNGETYRESNGVKPGEQAVVASTPWGGLGLTICYDVRFGYLHRALAHAGAAMLTVPAAFTVPTGQAHWHVLLRARAIETGCYVFAPAQTGEHAEGRLTYGHSLIVSPWGEVLADAGEKPGFVIADVDLDEVQKARSMVPALRHDREFQRPLSQMRAASE